MKLRNQNGTALATLILVFGAAALTTMVATVLVSLQYARQAKDDLLLHASYSAYESCLGWFNNTTNKVAQAEDCAYGQCLNLETGVGCTACGDSVTQLPVGDDCYCRLKYDMVDGNSINFEATGICGNGQTQFINNVSLDYTCIPDCDGKCGGDDGCGSTCFNICSTDPLNPECATDNITCCNSMSGPGSTPCF